MRDELRWTIAHIRRKRADLRSDRSPQELIEAISTKIAPRPTRRDEIISGLTGDLKSYSTITFDEFVSDFESHGSESIDARDFWGMVLGSKFQIEIAAGLGAQRWWLPRMEGEVFAEGKGGSLVRYQLRGIQRHQVFVTTIGVAMSIVAVCAGIGLLAAGSALTGAVFALAIGVLMLVLSLWFIRTAARIGTAMEQSLVRGLTLLAN